MQLNHSLPLEKSELWCNPSKAWAKYGIDGKTLEINGHRFVWRTNAANIFDPQMHFGLSLTWGDWPHILYVYTRPTFFIGPRTRFQSHLDDLSGMSGLVGIFARVSNGITLGYDPDVKNADPHELAQFDDWPTLDMLAPFLLPIYLKTPVVTAAQRAGRVLRPGECPDCKGKGYIDLLFKRVPCTCAQRK